MQSAGPGIQSDAFGGAGIGGEFLFKRCHFRAEHELTTFQHSGDGGMFQIIIDPSKCKGCAECVEVCHALGYDALHMLDKVAEEAAEIPLLRRTLRQVLEA